MNEKETVEVQVSNPEGAIIYALQSRSIRIPSTCENVSVEVPKELVTQVLEDLKRRYPRLTIALATLSPESKPLKAKASRIRKKDEKANTGTL